MPTFRKRPVVINAMLVTEREEIITLEGTMIAERGDWLITGVEGERYPCKDSVFRATYEPADEEARVLLDDATSASRSTQ